MPLDRDYRDMKFVLEFAVSHKEADSLARFQIANSALAYCAIIAGTERRKPAIAWPFRIEIFTFGVIDGQIQD
jgi:hypothetical protein